MVTGLELYYFERAGYFVRRGALPGAQLDAMREAAERTVARCRAGEYASVRWSDAEHTDFWGVNHIYHPDIREQALVDALAVPDVLGVFEDLFGGRARFHLGTLLSAPERIPYRLPWHRDLGPDLDASPEEQIAHLARHLQHAQINGALIPDKSLWVVPGTHSAPLDPEQRAAIAADPCGPVPGAVCVRLAPGDVVFYNANLLHRGDNREQRPRLTLHAAVISLEQPVQPIVPQPWLAAPEFLSALPEPLRPLFKRAIAAGVAVAPGAAHAS